MQVHTSQPKLQGLHLTLTQSESGLIGSLMPLDPWCHLLGKALEFSKTTEVTEGWGRSSELFIEYSLERWENSWRWWRCPRKVSEVITIELYT